MKPLSQRRAFTGSMSLLATAFVIGIWRQKFSYQSDFLADILKVSVCVAISTAVISFISWTLTHSKKTPFQHKPLTRGVLAGILTALVIIPLPAFAWGFKTEFLSTYQSGEARLLGATFKAGFLGVKLGLGTFLDISKAALIAVSGSALVGVGVTHYVRPKSSHTKVETV